MAEQILQLRERTHLCTLTEKDGVRDLQHILYQIGNLIRQEVRADSNSILTDITTQLKEAETHLNIINQLDNNGFRWKNNLQEFSKAKAGILYSLNLLQAALRFGKLFQLQTTFNEV
jgi:hypothetical protein